MSIMERQDPHRADITPQILLRAYASGIFPMAESADDPALYWVEPDARGIIPLDTFSVPSRLARTVRGDKFTVTINKNFARIVDECAAPREGRVQTWINARIRDLYLQLFKLGHAHSVEVFDADGMLAGGLYGVSLGRAFFGESMFHIARDASKVALVHLVARLIRGGFVLLDTQFVTDHLRTLGAVEISRDDYRALLDEALIGDGDFRGDDASSTMSGAQALAIITAHVAALRAAHASQG